MMSAEVTDIKIKIENVSTKEASGTKKKTEFSSKLATVTRIAARTLNKILLIKTAMTRKLSPISLPLI